MRRICYTVLIGCGILAAFVPDTSGPDTVCQWPRDSGGALELSDARQSRHLSYDAEKAEDLAIRFADGHSRPGTGGGHSIIEYLRTLKQCNADLFLVIAEHHQVTPQQVRDSLGKNRHTSIDVVVMLFFGLAYALFVDSAVRRIWTRFPSNEEPIWGILATVLISLVVSLLGVVLGEFWADAVEFLRIGYGHLVDRVYRIPWVNHQPAIFVAGVIIFWVLSWWRYLQGGCDCAHERTVLGLLDPVTTPLPNKEK